MTASLFNIHDMFLLFTALQSVLLGFFTLFMPRQNRFAMRWLCAFFISIGIYNFCTELLWNDEVAFLRDMISAPLVFLLSAATIATGPLLWCYLKAFTSQNGQIKTIQWWHFFPAVALPLVTIVLGVTADTILIDGRHLTFSSPSGWLLAATRTVPLVYAIITVRYVWGIREHFQENFPWVQSLGIEWLMLLSMSYLVLWAWSFWVQVTGGWMPTGVADIFGVAANYVSFVLINTLFFVNFYFAMRITRTQMEFNREREKKVDVDFSAVDKIMAAITEQKIFCQKNMTIEKFSDAVGLPVKEVSQVINTHFESNFVEFINTHRVREVQRLLEMPEHQTTAIAKLYYMAGFNSKSAFQRFFKRVAGVSPTEYREQQCRDAE